MEGRFYRPELDALRFFAFLAVLVHHGPAAPGVAGMIRDIGGFGLSMFFVLSAYLITELLLREHARTGSVSLKFFYIRRALRIWPLYLAAQSLRLLPIDVERLIAPLWSILIEEEFYLIWPMVIRWRAVLVAAIFLISVAAVWIWIFADKGWLLWYDPPVEFLFFAIGALIALAKPNIRRVGDRIFLFGAGSVLLLVAAKLGIGSAEVTGLTRSVLLPGYCAAALGCASIFLAIPGVRVTSKSLIYGGRISYGLYVFHSGMLELAERLRLPPHTVLRMVTVDAAALLLSIGAAHLSYQYFERPFLLLKERFAVVKSSIPFVPSR